MVFEHLFQVKSWEKEDEVKKLVKAIIHFQLRIPKICFTKWTTDISQQHESPTHHRLRRMSMWHATTTSFWTLRAPGCHSRHCLLQHWGAGVTWGRVFSPDLGASSQSYWHRLENSSKDFSWTKALQVSVPVPAVRSSYSAPVRASADFSVIFSAETS